MYAVCVFLTCMPSMSFVFTVPMYALYVCLIRMPYMYALKYAGYCTSSTAVQHAECAMCMPSMYAVYVCLICMPYMYALYVCLPICVSYMYALSVCMPYMYVL